MSKFIIFDTETTGLKVEENQIAQLSYIIIDSELRILKSENFYFNVEKVEKGASEINGLTVEKLKELSDGKIFKDYAYKIFNDFNDAKIICHNVKFDMSFLSEEFRRIDMNLKIKDSFCTMLNYRNKLKIKHEKYGYKYPKLEEVIKYLGVDEEIIRNVMSAITPDRNIGYHDARYDIACTYVVFKYLEDIKPNREFEAYLERTKRQDISLKEMETPKKKESLSIQNNLIEKIKGLKGCFNFLVKKKI